MWYYQIPSVFRVGCFLAAVLVPGGALPLSAGSNSDPETVLARIGDVHIASGDLYAKIEAMQPHLRTLYQGDQGLKRLLNEEIAVELLYREGLSQDLDQDKTYLDRLHSLSKLLLARRYAEVEILKKAVVTEEQARRFFEEHRKEYLESESISASFILLKSTPSMTSEEKHDRKHLLEQLSQRVAAGEDFLTLREKYTEDRLGSAIEDFPRGRLVPDIEDEVFALSSGTVSKVFVLDDAFLLFFVHGHKEPVETSFSNSRQTIFDQLLPEQRAKDFEAEVDRLAKKYQLKVMGQATDRE